MNNFKRYMGLLIATLLLSTSCEKYLDVVPEGQATLDDLFASESQAQEFLYTLYGAVPSHGWVWIPDMFAGDDMITGAKGTTRWYQYKSVLYGEENANQSYFGLWSTAGTAPTGRSNYEIYKSIRYCYLFLDRIGSVPGISEENLRHWQGEAYWLIAYYHQTLLDFYGPVVLVRRNIPLDASEEEMYPPRAPYDECVDFIAENWDRAAGLLPAKWQTAMQGRATAAAAKAYKARLLLHAASPMYNGNSADFAGFNNPDGTPLMPQVYQAEKWERALVACREAIEYAEANGYRLYTNPSSVPISDFEQGVMNYHDAFTETIWNDSEVFFGKATQTALQNLQRHSSPRQWLPYSTDGFRNQVAPTMEAVEMYYTKNGLPLDVDPLTRDLDLYAVAPGDSTALLHRNREPRFYANVGFDRGDFDINGETQTLYLRGRELHGSTLNTSHEYQTSTGYLNKKYVHKQTLYNRSTITFTYQRMVYPYIRLAELYLSYAEADFEYNGSLSSTSLTYLNKVRQRCGLPNFETSWALVGGIPSGDALRNIIRQERSIEMFGEGRRYHDIRRWNLARDIMNNKPKAWNLNGTTQEAFYTLSTMPESGQRVFEAPKNTWLAIPLEELNINQQLVQNPGY